MLPRYDDAASQITFGCSNLLGTKTAQEGLQLLNAAYTAGIRSFDVARVYNYGDAERLVGQFSAPHRHELLLTTKFGLAPNAQIAKMGGAINLVRSLMRSSTFIRKLVRRNAGKMMHKGRFDIQSAQVSLEESLRALQTDYIDVYLLHEATVADCADDIFEFLTKAREQGKIIKFGVGSAYEQIDQIREAAPRFLGVAQFESSPANNNRLRFEAIRPAETALIVTHGSFSGTEMLSRELSQGGSQVGNWSRRVGFDLASPGLFHAALLRCALRRNPGGKVIFRASTPQRIAQNMRALEIVLKDQQLDELETLCREMLPS